ncbi:hypothetical protein VE23_25285 [Paenibacillus sp. D9]|uniref:hypothetical protein n=1 Tax=Paenibacillus sp. D9 TaxID=665792 RepID=UPI00061EC645|nr:hypothetical protein [Paenibacillus sp. D9]KKC45837.1 hypothetical protein VE23_25285 [Paenibacillus sp. D9]
MDDVSRMPAGPELDAEMARALGWIEIEMKYSGAGWSLDGVHPIYIQDRFTPSTTWDGAGQVIEEMQRRGWELALNVTGVGVAASFHRQGSYHPFKFFIASYGPFVITIAAILALRSEADHEPPELDK